MSRPDAPTRTVPLAAMHEVARHEVLRFAGVVECRVGDGAVGVSLRGASTPLRSSPALSGQQAGTASAGTDRSSPAPAARASEVLLGGVTAGTAALPDRLHDVRLIELEQPRHFRIEAREGSFELRAGGIQRHCDDVGTAFFAALPRTGVSLRTRWGWSMLLAMLRIGPLARLIARRG